MTRTITIILRGFAAVLTVLAGVWLALYLYPYVHARICWSTMSWTSDRDFMVALFIHDHPHITETPIVTREASGILRAEGGSTVLRTGQPYLQYPQWLSRNDELGGLIAMPVLGPFRIAFLDSCGNHVYDIM